MENLGAATAAVVPRTGVGEHPERSGPPRAVRSAPTPPPRHGGTGRLVAAVLALTTLLFVGALLVPASGTPIASQTATGGAALTAAVSSSAGPTCNPVRALAPSALYMTTGVPLKNVTPGGTLTGELEFAVLNFTNATSPVTLALPAIFYKFPLAAGGNFSMEIAPRNITVASAGWTAANALARSSSVPAGLVFKKGSEASLTSMKVSIMANDRYGNVTIEARWRWGSTPAPGHSVWGSWTVPTSKTKSPHPDDLPSIFYPAPYADLVSSTGAVATIGASYNATLAGPLIAGQLFFLEMEYPSGKVVQDLGQTAPANATSYNVTIPMLNYNGALTPGSYLVHIHDACGGLLYNKVIKAVYPANATISFFIEPGNCGSVTFGGQTFTNNTSGTFTPSPTSYNFSLTGCKHHTFQTWVTTGGLHITSGSSMQVSASGTFTVEYR